MENLLPGDVTKLKGGTDGAVANRFAHPAVNDEQTTELLWQTLDEFL